jgi:hypothetical protein
MGACWGSKAPWGIGKRMKGHGARQRTDTAPRRTIHQQVLNTYSLREKKMTVGSTPRPPK